MEEKSFTLFYDGGDLPTAKLYRDSESGVIFREFKLDTGLGINPVRICQITDMHFNALNDEDRKNPELAYTETCRTWLKGGASTLSCDRAMKYSRAIGSTICTTRED